MEGLVGREAVLGRAAAFLDRVSDGPTALVIDGEVGLGKTAVWLHTVAAAEARGYRVLRARPAESEATLAYSGIADLVSAVFEEVKAVLPPPQQRALAAALLLADGEQPAAFRATATAFVNVQAPDLEREQGIAARRGGEPRQHRAAGCTAAQSRSEQPPTR